MSEGAGFYTVWTQSVHLCLVGYSQLNVRGNGERPY